MTSVSDPTTEVPKKMLLGIRGKDQSCDVLTRYIRQERETIQRDGARDSNKL